RHLPRSVRHRCRWTGDVDLLRIPAENPSPHSRPATAISIFHWRGADPRLPVRAIDAVPCARKLASAVRSTVEPPAEHPGQPSPFVCVLVTPPICLARNTDPQSCPAAVAE